MDSLATSLSQYDAAADHAARRICASVLADEVRRFLKHKKKRQIDEDDDDVLDKMGMGRIYAENSTTRLGLTIIRNIRFDYDGVSYSTAMNAFQAQKQVPERRHEFSNINWFDPER